MWVCFFAAMAAILGANNSLAVGYTNIPIFYGYIIQSFENSIGNISPPSFGILKKDKSTLHLTIDYLVYFFWVLCQIFMLIILLNFVIALIS